MKTGLKRIEATLHDLGNRSSTPGSDSLNSCFSFRISTGATESTLEATQTEEVGAAVPLEDITQDNLYPQKHCVQTFPAQDLGGKTPSLPKFKHPSFSSHRHGANPALAMNILQDIQEHIASWQRELQTILQQIQEIYLQGPIVNGWLESRVQEVERGGTATLRHGEVDRIMEYVEQICAHSGTESQPSPRTGYHLCGLDAAGKVWSRACSADELPIVSLAIARYQKLRQLLGRKQYLETRLSQLAETLVILHSNMQQP